MSMNEKTKLNLNRAAAFVVGGLLVYEPGRLLKEAASLANTGDYEKDQMHTDWLKAEVQAAPRS